MKCLSNKRLSPTHRWDLLRLPLLLATILVTFLIAIGCRSGAQVPQKVEMPILQPTRSAKVCQNEAYSAEAPQFNEQTSLPFTEQPSGLKVHDVKKGNGDTPIPGSTVEVRYTGWFEDGCVFDSNYHREEPFEFKAGLNQVILGWEEALATMQAGGIRRVEIPPSLAYGPLGFAGTIPPDATLEFIIELVTVKPPEESQDSGSENSKEPDG